MNDELTIVVCAVIINHNNMILVASRAQNLSHGGRWEFPGGKVTNEISPCGKEINLEDSVISHVKEELGIDVSVCDKMDSYEAINREGRTFEMHPYFARIVDRQQSAIPSKIHLERHERAEWFAADQLLQLAWPDTDMPIIDEILDRIIRHGKII